LRGLSLQPSENPAELYKLPDRVGCPTWSRVSFADAAALAALMSDLTFLRSDGYSRMFVRGCDWLNLCAIGADGQYLGPDQLGLNANYLASETAISTLGRSVERSRPTIWTKKKRSRISRLRSGLRRRQPRPTADAIPHWDCRLRLIAVGKGADNRNLRLGSAMLTDLAVIAVDACGWPDSVAVRRARFGLGHCSRRFRSNAAGSAAILT
jgi:hypothetical protein